MNDLLTPSELAKSWSYNPISGQLWKTGYGSVLDGKSYVIIETNPITKTKRRVRKLDLVFALHFGRWPWHKVRAYDGNECNLKLENLDGY